jgi:uncharacterized protein (TIGR02145 family)
MKKMLVEIMMAGVLCLGSAVCAAQEVTVCTSTSYTIPSAVAADGASTYQWLENGEVIPGATGASYTNLAGKSSAGTYVYVRRAEIDGCGWQNSNAFVVYISGTVNTPVITAPAEGCAGASYIFTVPVIPGGTYEWTGSGSGGSSNSNSYTYLNAVEAGTLTVSVRTQQVVNGVMCTSASATSSVTIHETPNISTQPAGTSICPEFMTTLSVTASPVTAYQWYENGTAITTEGSGFTSAIYTTPALISAATYTVIVANGACSVTSNQAVVSMGSWNACCTPVGKTAPFDDFIPCPDAATGSTWTLTDPRDSKTYKVRLMEDGHVWMVQDLKFGSCAGTATWYYDSTAVAITHPPTVAPGYVGHCATLSSQNGGYYYSWPAAMNSQFAYYGSTLTFCAGSVSEPAQPNPSYCRGICPERWHVPTSGSEGETAVLARLLSWNTQSAYLNSAFVPTRYDGMHPNGSIFDGSGCSIYWSSTMYAGYPNHYGACYSVVFFTDRPQIHALGLPVRCVLDYY